MTPSAVGTFQFYLAAEATQTATYFTNQFTVNLICDPAVLTSSVFTSPQQAGEPGSPNGYQVF